MIRTGAVIATTTTNPDGSYSFGNLPPGDYVVEVTDPPSGPGITQTGDPDGTLDNKTTAPITLTNGESVPNIDFGYNDPALSDVSGTVFYDVDTDGTYEPVGNDGTGGNADDESGIGAVTLTLSPTYDIIDGQCRHRW